MTMPESIRAFIAMRMPTRQLEELAHVQQELRPRFRRINWTRPESMHLTLHFLGEMGTAAIPTLSQRLGEIAAGIPPLELELAELGSFGNRVLWIGFRQGAPELSALAAKVRCAAVGSSRHQEERPYHPHVTLGRAHGHQALASILERSSLPARITPWRGEGMELVRSELLSEGARYTTLASFAFSAPPYSWQGQNQ